MEQTKEVAVVVDGRDITPVGKTILDMLAKTWKKKEVFVDGYETDEETGIVSLVKVKQARYSGNVRLNKGVSPELFAMFGTMVKPEDEDRILRIVEAGCFEVVKAVKVFQVPQLIADQNAIPKSWNQSFEMDSPTLASIVKYKGEFKAARLVYALLFPFCKAYGRRNDMTEGDVLQVCEHIVAKYRRFTITDIKMILNDALEVSKQFNLDFQGIKALFAENYEARQEMASRIAIQEHNRVTVEEKDRRERYQPGQKTDPKTMAVMVAYYNEQKNIQKANAS